MFSFIVLNFITKVPYNDLQQQICLPVMITSSRKHDSMSIYFEWIK